MRDLLTSTSEQAAKGKSKGSNPTLKADAVPVDAVVSTIGFPLVGGPAGTMEGGRQADVAKGILTAKNIPYIIAAPLLIQVRVPACPWLQTHSTIRCRSSRQQKKKGCRQAHVHMVCTPVLSFSRHHHTISSIMSYW